MKINKISKSYDNKGSAMILVIICIAILAILLPVIAFQNINQIRSTSNNQLVQNYKYAAEAGIDLAIAESLKQVEEKVKYNKSSKSVKYNKYSNDKFYYIKDEIKLLVSKLDSIDEDTEILKVNINSIINKEYKNSSELIQDLMLIKEQFIMVSGNIGYENIAIRESIYNLLNELDNIIEIGYYYEHIDHTPFEFRNSSEHKDWNLDQIEYKFKGNYGSSGEDYTIERIKSDEVSKAMDETQKAKDSIDNSYQNVKNYINNNLIYGILNKIKTDYLTGGVSPTPGYESVNNELQKLMDILHQGGIPSDDKFRNKKLDVCKSIDGVIEKINNAEKELYKIYTEKQSHDPGAWNPNEYNIHSIRPYVMNSIKYLDITKRNLIETKCKLGDKFIPPTNDSNKPDSGGGESKPGDHEGELQIIIENKTYQFYNDIKYTIDAIEEEIPVSYGEDGKITEVNDIIIDIISEGHKNNSIRKSDRYKIKSSVVIKTKKQDGIFKCSYEIISHSAIS